MTHSHVPRRRLQLDPLLSSSLSAAEPPSARSSMRAVVRMGNQLSLAELAVLPPGLSGHRLPRIRRSCPAHSTRCCQTKFSNHPQSLYLHLLALHPTSTQTQTQAKNRTTVHSGEVSELRILTKVFVKQPFNFPAVVF